MAKKVSSSEKKAASNPKKSSVKSDKNNILLNEVIECMTKSQLEISADSIKATGFDVSLAVIEVPNSNIRLERKFLSTSFTIKSIDNRKDIFGNPLNSHQPLWNCLCEAYRSNINFVFHTELAQIGIASDIDILKIENFCLKVGIGSFSRLSMESGFSISIIDKEKNFSNKWIDASVNLEKIRFVLMNYIFPEKDLENADEVEWNKSLEEYFSNYFATAYKGEKNRNKINMDIIVGSGKNEYGLELKLAKKLLVGTKSRDAMGQLLEYSKQFGKRIVVVILGDEKSENLPKITMLRDFAEDNGLNYYYMTPVKKQSRKK